MPAAPDVTPAPIPTNSLWFGYGPMLPFVAAAVAAWSLPPPWPALATRLAIIWGGAILVFVAGVRRGYAFGKPAASTAGAIATMLPYFVAGALALVCGSVGWTASAMVLLVLGFALVVLLDRQAALAGDAPPFFARLRPAQMGIAILSLAALLLR